MQLPRTVRPLAAPRKLYFGQEKRHINFEHINFLKVGTTLGQGLGQPLVHQREKFIFPCFEANT